MSDARRAEMGGRAEPLAQPEMGDGKEVRGRMTVSF